MVMKRFWEKVDKGDQGECWEWQAARMKPGEYGNYRYGQFRYRGQMRLAHRVAYQLEKGEIPDGMQVNHTCDNPPCVNPDHLYLGTQAENMQDAIEAGHRDFSGEKNARAKLAEDDVRDIKRRLKDGAVQARLAEEYDVSTSTITAINRGENWPHIDV